MMMKERKAIAVLKAGRSVMTLTIRTMITLIIQIKDSSSHQGLNTDYVARVTREMKTNTEVETKEIIITGIGEDSVMKEVEVDHKILLAVNLKKATIILIDNSLPLFLRIAVKCIGNRISRECIKVSYSRNKLVRLCQVKTTTSSNLL